MKIKYGHRYDSEQNPAQDDHIIAFFYISGTVSTVVPLVY